MKGQQIATWNACDGLVFLVEPTPKQRETTERIIAEFIGVVDSFGHDHFEQALARFMLKNKVVTK